MLIYSLKEDWDHVQRERQICYFGNIYTNEIMIEYDSRYYGPFEYDKKEDYIALIGIKEHKYFISEYEYSELNDSIYLVDNPDGNDCVRFIVKSAIQSPMDRNNNIDWIDDDKLIEYLSTILKRKKLNTKDEVRRFKENISTLVKEDVEMCLNSSRNERLCRILNLIDDRNELLQMIARNILEDEVLNEEVVRIICEEHFEYIESNSSELKAYHEKLEELNRKEASITEHIQRASANLTVLEEQARSNQKEQIEKVEKEIAILKEQKVKLEGEIEQLLSTINEINEIKSLEEKRDALKQEATQALAEKNIREKDLNEVKDKQKELDTELKKIIENFNNETKIAVSKLDKDFLSKVFNEVSGEQNTELKLFDKNLFYIPGGLSGDEITGIVYEYLNDKANRNISYNEVVNY